MKSLQSALNVLSFDPVLARLFGATPWDEVARLAGWVAETDPDGEAAAITRALQLASGGAGELEGHVEHQLWCAWRQAAWTSGLAQPLPVRAMGREWLAETQGRPTVLITPMTLCAADALSAIAQMELGRPCVVFGEDVDAASQRDLEVVTGESSEPVRRIIEVLDRGGILCTYPDFVYAGRSAEPVRLFGVERPISSGFLSIAARTGTLLIPAVCLRDGDGVTIHIEEALEVQAADSAQPAERAAARRLLAGTVGELLEGLIRQAPAQWLLLPTLTFEAPQIARAAPVRA